jgi:hypothetical protein
MEQAKTRYYITPSSLASYFGCGFNSPEDQFKIDSGEVPAEFDEDSRLRMELGNHLEDAVIEYFQNAILKAPITDRNTETKWGYDGKIRYKLDGKTVLKGEEVIFENKISNSQSYKFTENKGYHIQVQAYMLCEDLNKTILAGLYQGKPIYKIVERDEELVEDIKTMTDFVVSALHGLVDFYDDFPVDLLEKYSNSQLLEPITDLSEGTVEYLHQLAELNEKKSEIEKEIKELKKQHEHDFEISAGVYEDDVVKVTVSRWIQKGGFDLDEFQLRNPDFETKPYMKPDTERSKVVIKRKTPQ